MSQLRLALVIHNHQPIGNFDDIFEQAYQDSYKPFLDLLAEFPSLAITLHNSGSLLEWLVEHRPRPLVDLPLTWLPWLGRGGLHGCARTP